MDIIGIRQTQVACAIAGLINSAYRGTSGERRWTTENGLIEGDRISTQAVADIILDKKYRVFAAFDENDQPHCCIAVEFDEIAKTAEFGMFAVHPENQGTGLGSELLKHAETYALKRAELFRVSVVNLNQQLIEFYKRRGYQTTGEELAYPLEANVGQPVKENITLVVLEKSVA